MFEDSDKSLKGLLKTELVFMCLSMFALFAVTMIYPTIGAHFMPVNQITGINYFEQLERTDTTIVFSQSQIEKINSEWTREHEVALCFNVYDEKVINIKVPDEIHSKSLGSITYSCGGGEDGSMHSHPPSYPVLDQQKTKFFTENNIPPFWFSYPRLSEADKTSPRDFSCVFIDEIPFKNKPIQFNCFENQPDDSWKRMNIEIESSKT